MCIFFFTITQVSCFIAPYKNKNKNKMPLYQYQVQQAIHVIHSFAKHFRVLLVLHVQSLLLLLSPHSAIWYRTPLSWHKKKKTPTIPVCLYSYVSRLRATYYISSIKWYTIRAHTPSRHVPCLILGTRKQSFQPSTSGKVVCVLACVLVHTYV